MSLFHSIDIRFADPISAIGTSDDFIVVGSMMGRIALLNKNDKKCGLLAELSTENITGITFIDNNTCFISIGDEEVLKYTLDSTGNNHESQRFQNYDNENNHRNKCENTYCLLSKQCLLMIELNQQADNGNINICSSPNVIKIKNNLNGNLYDYEVQMSNYSIPFDYDGERFLWVEFLNEKERNICVFNFNEQTKWEYRLTKSFGHISFARFINQNQVLLVKQLNDIEIREIDQSFTIKHTFKNIGDEVIALDVYYNNSSDNVDNKIDNNNKLDDKIMVIKKEKKDSEKLNEKLEKINSNNDKLNVNDTPTIILVDIDGNVNSISNYQKLVTKFNMYEVKDIPQDIKEKQFFSMGYPYFIKAEHDLLTISTDFGVFVFKNS